MGTATRTTSDTTTTWSIDPGHSNVEFAVKHLMISSVKGRFGINSGALQLNDADPSKTTVEIEIDAASVDTRQEQRDNHLRSADFFNAAEFPKMTYKSTGVAFSGDNPMTIDGNLTLLGVTKPLQLTVERFKCNPAQGTGKERCGGNATGKLKRSDFGMKTGIPNLGDEVTLLIMFEALKD